MTQVNLLNRIGSNHLWKNALYTLFLITLIVIVGRVLFPKSTEVLVSLLVLSPFLVIGLGILAIVAVVAIVLKTGSLEQLENEQVLLGGVIRNVPANQIWVLRSAWGSDSKTGKGYTVKKEGWRFYIPKILHIDLGLVNLSPVPRDPQSITVNTSDNQTAIIDFRLITHVSDPIAFAVKVGENRKSFEDQAASVALNRQAATETQAQLTEFEKDKDELKSIGEGATASFNKRMEELVLGIEADAIEVQKILMPEEIRAAKEYQTVAEIREKASETRGRELHTIASKTGADPTKIVLADIIRDGFTDVIGLIANFLKTFQETKQKEEKETSKK